MLQEVQVVVLEELIVKEQEIHLLYHLLKETQVEKMVDNQVEVQVVVVEQVLQVVIALRVLEVLEERVLL
tara:strand:- start:295 stop:504 length:210 start_codon:yes stop_codon:yes gene_type:complete